MNKKIIECLKVLEIPTLFMESKSEKDKYIIFSVYNEKDIDVFDDVNRSVLYYIQLNYWFNDTLDMDKYKEIKRILKENGFIFVDCKDRKEDGYFCKAMTFKYKERVM